MFAKPIVGFDGTALIAKHCANHSFHDRTLPSIAVGQTVRRRQTINFHAELLRWTSFNQGKLLSFPLWMKGSIQFLSGIFFAFFFAASFIRRRHGSALFPGRYESASHSTFGSR